MFKYKSSPIVILVLLVFSVIFFTIYYKVSKIEIEKDNKLIKNNIEFSGIIEEMNVSGNHSFGILKLKILKTNREVFKAFSKNNIYPYAIEDSIAEVYTKIPVEEIKRCYKVEINSNNKTVKFLGSCIRIG